MDICSLSPCLRIPLHSLVRSSLPLCFDINWLGIQRHTLSTSHSSTAGSTTSPEKNTTSAHTASSYFIDYWLSFTNGLDPNDGKGVQREFYLWPCFLECPLLMGLV